MRSEIMVVVATIVRLHVSFSLTEELPKMILDHFSDGNSLNAFFCKTAEANSFVKAAASIKSFKVSVFPSENYKISLFIGQHRLGIFADTVCHEGRNFLQQNRDQFNSSYRWLLWTVNLDETVGLLESTRLDYDSDVTIIRPAETAEYAMLDVYRKHKDQSTILTEYQRWVGGQVYSLAPLSERGGLDGITFTGAIIVPDWENVSLSMLTDIRESLGLNARERYGITLFLTICQHYMNCSVQPILIHSMPGETMLSQSNNSMERAMSLISSGMADFGIVPFAMEINGDDIIDYSLPIFNQKYKYVFIRPKMIGSWSALVRPLSPAIWLYLFVLLLLVVVAFKIVSLYDKSAPHNQTWAGCCFVIVSALAQQGVPDNVYKLTTRIVCLSVLIVTYLSWIYYSTALLNGLLLPPPNAIQLTQDLFDSHLDIGVEDTPDLRQRIMRRDYLDAALREKLAKIRHEDRFLPSQMGMEKIVEQPFAFLAEEMTLNRELWRVRMTYAEICSIGLIDDEELPMQASFVHRKNSPYKELLRKGIIRSRERGAMDSIRMDWFPSVPPCLWKQDLKQIGFVPHAVAYVIIILGVIASLVIFSGEKFRNCALLKSSMTPGKQE